MSGANGDWRNDLTRPDYPLPQRPADTPFPSGPGPGAALPGPGSAGPGMPGPGMAGPSAASGTKPKSAPAGWHRLHFPVGVFLIAYGLASTVAAVLSWSDRRDQVASYLDSGVAGTVLMGVKGMELLLVLVTVLGLVRRRDVWFLPPLACWMAGFGVLAVLDVLRGKWGGLVEHVGYLLLFGVLLFVSYGLGVKARIGGGGSGDGGNLSRTQELALAALNRIPRPAGPPSRPAGPQFSRPPAR